MTSRTARAEKNSTSSHIPPVIHRVQDAIGDMADKVSTVGSQARDSAKSAISTLTSAMKDHPVATVAIGLVAGYLFARLRHRG